MKTKTFIHKFLNGQTIKLVFYLHKTQPYCHANLAIDKQPVEILNEYRMWQNLIVVPELMNVLTPVQMKALAEFGKKKMME